MYEKNGEMLPGKKGISLTKDQFVALQDLMKSGQIDDAIKEIS